LNNDSNDNEQFPKKDSNFSNFVPRIESYDIHKMPNNLKLESLYNRSEVVNGRLAIKNRKPGEWDQVNCNVSILNLGDTYTFTLKTSKVIKPK